MLRNRSLQIDIYLLTYLLTTRTRRARCRGARSAHSSKRSARQIQLKSLRTPPPFNYRLRLSFVGANTAG